MGNDRVSASRSGCECSASGIAKYKKAEKQCQKKDPLVRVGNISIRQSQSEVLEGLYESHLSSSKITWEEFVSRVKIGVNQGCVSTLDISGIPFDNLEPLADLKGLLKITYFPPKNVDAGQIADSLFEIRRVNPSLKIMTKPDIMEKVSGRHQVERGPVNIEIGHKDQAPRQIPEVRGTIPMPKSKR